MFLLLAFLFLVIPLVELYVIIKIAGGIGVLETIGLLILVSVVGACLVRREGLGVLRKMQSELAQERLPAKQLVDGALILFAGALMLTPGFVTDATGVLLLIPPTRIVVRNLLMRRLTGRINVASPFGATGFPNPVVDVDGQEQTPGFRDIVDLRRNDDPDNPPPSLPS